MRNKIKKKILYYLETYSFGGIEKVVDTYYDYFSSDYNIDVLCGENLTDKKINHLLNKNHNHYIRTILCFKEFNKYLSNHKYDIIHIHIYNGIGLKYAYIASNYCNKIIIHAHNNGFNNDFFKIKKLINNFFIKKYSNKYIYVSVSKSASMFCFNKESIIIPNSFNYDLYKFNDSIRQSLRNKYNINDSSIVIGNIGRLDYQKNQKFLIKVFNEYNRINPDSYLFLIGKGNNNSRINRMNNNIIMLDYKDNINDYYNMFDVYASPSLFEGFGRTIVEAQINGLYTIVSSNVSSDVIISDNVIKLELNVDDWIKKINKIQRTTIVNKMYLDKEILEFINKKYIK